MSVAETRVVEQTPRSRQQQLAVSSAVGALLVLAGLWFIFAGEPLLWAATWETSWAQLGYVKNDFLSTALMVLLDLLVIGAFVFATYRLSQGLTQSGARAGVAVTAVVIFTILWIGVWIGSLMENQFSDDPTLGWIVLGVMVGALFAGFGFLSLTVPAWATLLDMIEHQGWFQLTSYKGNQGVRVRRGTIMGILAVGACGIITLVWNRFFGAETRTDDGILPNDWYWIVPYSHDLQYIPLMFKIHVMMPIVLAIVLVWVAWRVVNIPVFADFLIATEAEMNKVSWTNRKRLFQDTIVVLVTVFLFTGFLFVVDVIWIKVLSAPYVEVLLIDIKKEQEKQQQKAEW